MVGSYKVFWRTNILASTYTTSYIKKDHPSHRMAFQAAYAFWVKLVLHRLQVTVTTPLPRLKRSHALQPGHLKYLYVLRFWKRTLA